MADIFISYASEDRSRAEPLAKALKDQGWSVWWDRIIPPGKSFDQVIQEAIATAKCVVVLWSNKSIKSDWVKEEATIGKRRQILVPAKIDSVDPPLGFGLIQAADLTDWAKDTSHAGFSSLLSAISEIVGPPPQQEKSEQVVEISDPSLGQKLEPQPEEEKIPQPTSSQTKPAERMPSEFRKTRKILKFGTTGAVIVLLTVGVWWLISEQYLFKDRRTEPEQIQQGLEELYAQVLKLENATMRLDDPERIEELYRQRDTLNQKVEVFREKAIKVGLGSHLETLQNRFEGIKVQIDNRKQDLIAARKGRILVDFSPNEATVRILNIGQSFRQGMELDPGKYHVEVSSNGYETQDRWIELGVDEGKRIYFELAKTKVAEQVPPQKTITNSIGMKFVFIAAGTFTMGSRLAPKEVAKRYGGKPEYFTEEHPPHPVKITKPFYLQTTEVSQAQWKKVMSENPSHFKDCGDDCPVERVSWYDAKQFISKLNRVEGTTKYRLPTEAEWEYACRSGTTTPFSIGECLSTDHVNQANYNGNYPGKNCPKGQYRGKTVKVGDYQPNDWGLYDMHGNVWEWCQDWFGEYLYTSIDDPKGPDNGKYRLLRGGSWYGWARDLRSSSRLKGDPGHRDRDDIGFRVARDF